MKDENQNKVKPETAKQEQLTQQPEEVNTVASVTQRVNAAIQKTNKPLKSGTMLGLKSDDIRGLLDKYKAQIAQALPRHLTPERMIQIATTVISQNPEIQKCSAGSIIGAVMQSSILGFNPSPVLGQCYFVPYNKNVGTKEKPEWIKEAQFTIGYKGYIDLSRRSGELKNIDANVVREGDTFVYEYGLEPKLKHIPGTKRGKIKYAYAVAHYNNGGYNYVVLTIQQVEMLRMMSPSQKGTKPTGAWGLNDISYENMAKAKAVRQLAKYMPLSLDVATAMEPDGAILKPENFVRVDDNSTIVKIEEVENPENAIQADYETVENGK
jgi:recombination protein RecT